MVMKDLQRREVELMELLGNIRSTTMAQVRKFPGARPHRLHRKEMPEHRRLEGKKK